MRQKFKMSTLVMTAVLITAALSAKGLRPRERPPEWCKEHRTRSRRFCRWV